MNSYWMKVNCFCFHYNISAGSCALVAAAHCLLLFLEGTGYWMNSPTARYSKTMLRSGLQPQNWFALLFYRVWPQVSNVV